MRLLRLGLPDGDLNAATAGDSASALMAAADCCRAAMRSLTDIESAECCLGLDAEAAGFETREGVPTSDLEGVATADI